MASSHAGAMAAAESSLEAQKDSFADLGFEANAFETLERDFQEVLTELVRRPAAPVPNYLSLWQVFVSRCTQKRYVHLRRSCMRCFSALRRTVTPGRLGSAPRPLS